MPIKAETLHQLFDIRNHPVLCQEDVLVALHTGAVTSVENEDWLHTGRRQPGEPIEERPQLRIFSSLGVTHSKRRLDLFDPDARDESQQWLIPANSNDILTWRRHRDA